MSDKSPRCVSGTMMPKGSKKSTRHHEDASLYDESSYYPVSTQTQKVSNTSPPGAPKDYAEDSLDHSPSPPAPILKPHTRYTNGSVSSSLNENDNDDYSSWASEEDDNQSPNDIHDEYSNSPAKFADDVLMEDRSSPGVIRLTPDGLLRHERKTFDESMQVPVQAVGDGYCAWKRRFDFRELHKKELKSQDWDVLQPQPPRANDKKKKKSSLPMKPSRKELRKDVSNMSLAPLETLEDVDFDENQEIKPNRWPLGKTQSVNPQELLEKERSRECEYRKEQRHAEKHEARRIERLRRQEVERQRQLQGLAGPPPPIVKKKKKTKQKPIAERESHLVVDSKTSQEDPIVETKPSPPTPPRSPSTKKKVTFGTFPPPSPPKTRKKKKVMQSTPVVLNDDDATCCEESVEVVVDCLLSTAVQGMKQKRKAPSLPSKNCVVCTVNTKTHVALPCRHDVFCRDCVWRMQQTQLTSVACPVCNTPKVKFMPMQHMDAVAL